MPEDQSQGYGGEAEGRERLWGKFRGTVSDNADPLRLGRIRARVPAVLGDVDSGWAMPCAPYAGPQAGLFSIPPVGAGVWIEFEAGDVSRPIWSGCWWGAGEAPVTPPAGAPGDPDVKLWRSEQGLTTALDDAAQKITISDASGANQIVIDARSGTVTIKGAAKVVTDAPLVMEGSAGARHPAVFGDELMTYLTQLVAQFNAHVHPGELAGGFLPVTPAPPVPPLAPPTPAMLSLKVVLE
jgi:hypothetical protein